MGKLKLIKELQTWKKEKGKNPTRNEFGKKYQIIKHFGSWTNALKESGLEANYKLKTKDNIIKEIKDFYAKNNRTPKQKEISDVRKFGKFNDLVIEAGLKIENTRKSPVKYKLTDNEILELVKDVLVNKKIKTAEELYELENIPSRSLIYKKFGSFSNICKILGLKEEEFRRESVNKNREELLEDYKNLSERLNKENGATAQDLDESKDTYKSNVYVKRFGGMTELRKLAGYEVKFAKQTKYTKEELIKILKTSGKVSAKTLDKNKKLPTSGVVLRAFKTTRLSDVWKELGLI